MQILCCTLPVLQSLDKTVPPNEIPLGNESVRVSCKISSCMNFNANCCHNVYRTLLQWACPRWICPEVDLSAFLFAVVLITLT